MKKSGGTKLKLSLDNYINIKLYLILVLIIMSLSIYARYNQYNYWTQHKEIYFVDNYPAMTTLDAYYWLRYAKEYKNNQYTPGGVDTLKAYPNHSIKPKPVPLLSFLIAKVSEITGLSIYKSGLMLVPILASLFVIPMALLFYYSSMPMAGIVGAFVGTFSWMYMIRTAMGRVDTDLLQLFFIFSASLFMLLMIKSKRYSTLFINLGLTLIVLYLFIWWYGHIAIAGSYGIIAFIILIIKTFKNKNMLIITSILSILALIYAYRIGYISNIIGLLNGYIFSVVEKNTIFPNIINTITETTHKSFSKNLIYVLSSKTLAILGLSAFIASLFFLRLGILTILPTILLAFMSFVSSNRAVMFLAPLIGVGIGFLLDAFIVFIKNRYKLNTAKTAIVSMSSIFIVILLLVKLSAFAFIPRPSIKASIISSFVDIKHRVKKANIFSWWDYGYAIEDIDSFATFHDGGTHGSARTYIIAKGFSDDNQTHLYNIISYIDKNGPAPLYTRIKKGENPAKVLNSILRYRGKLTTKDDYLLFTEDMIGKFGAISYFGNWNFKTKHSEPTAFQQLVCNSLKNNILSCSGVTFDLQKGLINNSIPIKRLIYVSNGHIMDNQNPHKQGLFVELILRKKALLFALVCNKDTYDTNFNQIYILGNYNKNYFEEVYNNYPYARMFRVKTGITK